MFSCQGLVQMFQFSEASPPKLIFSSLLMLFTMDDRRRRLEDAEDSLVPENKDTEQDKSHCKKNLGFESFISKVRIFTLNSKFWNFFLNFEVFSQKSDFFSLNLTLNSKFRLLLSEIWHFFLQMLTFNSKSWCFFSKIWWGFFASF